MRPLLLLALLMLVCGCGAASSRGEDAVTGASTGGDGNGEGASAAQAGSGPAASDEGPACLAPIGSPGEVWPRIESLRELPEEQLVGECALALVDLFEPWRALPVDLLAPLVAAERSRGTDLGSWVATRLAAGRIPALQVAAMDIVGRFELGGDPGPVRDAINQWREVAARLEEESPGRRALSTLLEEAAALPALLDRVTEVHRSRCLLEVNPLGFAVGCKPIHPQGKTITLSWRTATRDGLLDDVQLAECKGRSCGKLKKELARLLKLYRALLSDIEALKDPVFRGRLERLMVLPPFRSAVG